MATNKQKSHAERAVASSRSSKKTGGTAKKNVAETSKKTNQKNTVPEKKEQSIPPRVISAFVLAGVFIFQLVIVLTEDSGSGALVSLFADLMYGLIGRAGFYASIPAVLYIFLIHVGSGKRPVIARTICLISFVICVGSFAHIWNMDVNNYSGSHSIGDLFHNGISGTAGGVVCGLLAKFVHWLCDYAISYIILALGALLTLLGGMKITIPSIVRAIQNRPKPEWELEKTPRDPAEVMVNHLAQKKIERKEKKLRAAMVSENEIAEYRENRQHTDDLMKQIDADLETPVAAAQANPPIQVVDEQELFEDDQAPESIPVEMPPLKVDVRKREPRRAKKEPVEEPAEEATPDISEKKPEYCFPPISLLKAAEGGSGDASAEMRENSRRLNETLASFKIEAHITNVTRGPSVTRYEVELEKGVRLSKLTTAADDIALSLGASGVRIAAIPGKISVVGIEVPNRAVNTVSLREVIDSTEFNKAKSKASFAVGKDIGGNCIVGNIARLPHMLIAGTTGSGKSVCMNSVIISLLYKATPDDVKLIMVDPKMVELGIYNGIPHLLIPVVTDPKKAAGSLQWAVTEMMRRYKAMSDAGVRDIDSYNSIIESQEVDGKKMPKVVVIIDELADLMLVAAKEVEESICRIAQMGRAAGIHLIIATQRPSSDVITGLMKANIPSRIAFAVASAMESRIILDTMGAEKLVGKGDMLYAPIGDGKPKRVQGCFVSDPEVEAVATFVKENCTVEYDQKVMEDIDKKASQTGSKSPATASDPEPNDAELGGDEMLPAAVDVFMETGQASVSILQRRLKLGYARAARIVDEMEEKGIVGPFQGSKPRTILITKEQWETMKSGQTSQLAFDDLEEDEVEEELF